MTPANPIFDRFQPETARFSDSGYVDGCSLTLDDLHFANLSATVLEPNIVSRSSGKTPISSENATYPVVTPLYSGFFARCAHTMTLLTPHDSSLAGESES